MAETAAEAFRTAEKLVRLHDKVSVRQLQLYAGLYANVLRLAHRELDAEASERAMMPTRAQLSGLDNATSEECRTLLLELRQDACQLVQQLAERQPQDVGFQPGRPAFVPWHMLSIVVAGLLVLGLTFMARERALVRATPEPEPAPARVTLLLPR